MSDLRSAVVSAAVQELGSSNAAKYWADVAPDADRPTRFDWCGAFALWALHQAGLAKNWSWIFGQGFMARLPKTSSPLPGDFAFFDHNQHQAVVEKVSPTEVTLINGNGTAGKVSRSVVPIEQVTDFYSIAPLLKDHTAGFGIIAGAAALMFYLAMRKPHG